MSKPTQSKATEALQSAPGGPGEAEAPFATPTLARLYLAQGHHDEARRMASTLAKRGEGDPALDAAIARASDQDDSRRQAVLRALLLRVRTNRRLTPPADEGGGSGRDGNTSR